jgi:hypothetical protein
MELLSTMQESSIKRLLESEVSKVTGLEMEDLKTQSKTINYPKRVISNSLVENEDNHKSFEVTGLGSKILAVILSYPYLAKEIEDLNRFSDFNEPEVQLMIEVVSFFQSRPEDGISDLLSTLDKESASFVGALISINDPVDEQNAKAYLSDCLFNLRKSDSVTRILELKEIFDRGELSEDETFELQQHLLSNIHKLEDPEKNLLKALSQKSG